MLSSPPRRGRSTVAFSLGLLAGLALLVPHGPGLARAGEPKDPGRLTIDRIFASAEFRPDSFGPVHWLKKLGGYTTREPSATVKGSQDIVRTDPATGKREVLVSAANLVPPGETAALAIDEYAWSPDESLVLIYTNSKRVWRKNSRGDYWIFDVGARQLRKLGGGAPPASLTNARFSPDGKRVAYVRDRNLYAEDVAGGKVVPLTTTDSPHVLNGTFDWVYEEEFSLYDGYRWSPDGRAIAFWQLDTRGVHDYYLLNQTDGLYQQLTRFKYPKAGRPNSACRIGVVWVEKPAEAAAGTNDPKGGAPAARSPVWLDLPG